MIDDLIKVLKRVKNCDKALSNLEMARDNMLFKDQYIHEPDQVRYKKHVHLLICESIKLIKDEVL